MNETKYKPQYQNSAALVIGINDYAHVSPLAVACADAESIAWVLMEELGFPKENVAVLLNAEATKTNILKRFLGFDALLPDDRLLVFFAGHGKTVPSHRGPVGYLVPVDGRCDDKSTLIRWDEMTRDADLIPAKHLLFVMDACYSGLAMQRATGGGERRFVSDMLQRQSRQIITAGKADEPVADGGGPSGKNSLFTGYLLEGLRGKAANEEGVLTASYLMNYVYQKVSTDARSNQTPHFGYLDGDGDFILRTPGNEHLSGATVKDFLVKPVVERPEPPPVDSAATIRPAFAEKNGYSDPNSEAFGRNQWTKNLGIYGYSDKPGKHLLRPSCWLSLVMEPVSNQPISFDIGSLAKTLPNSRSQSSKPYEQFTMPSQSMTTAKSVILFDPDHAPEPTNEECWTRFIRIEKSGAIEHCDFAGVAGIRSIKEGEPTIKTFRYVQVIGVIWSFLYAARRILDFANYQAGVRYLVNLVGTKDSLLAQFSSKPGLDSQIWRQPFDKNEIFYNSWQNWRCRDANLQFAFQLVLGSLGEAEAKKLISDCAEQLGFAYNHKSTPRCFNFGTDIFPWEDFRPYDA